MTDTVKNITTKIAKQIMIGFESRRVLSKNVNTQMLDGKFNPSTGSTTLFKRPTDFVSTRTPQGDVSGSADSPIIVGNAEGNVQDYITVRTSYSEAVQALEFDGDDNSFFDKMAMRIVTDLELDFAAFMMNNSALQSGTVGTPVTGWASVAEARAIMQSTGIPAGQWNYAVNPFTQIELAGDQRDLGGETGTMTANTQAVIAENFAGMRVLTADTLSNYQTPADVDRIGAIASNPDVTYATAKDTMTQVIAVSGFDATLTIKAGERIRITGVNRLNLSTRQLVLDGSAAVVEYTATVVADSTMIAGAGNITVTGPAIFEATGAYNTVSRAPIAGDIVTLLASASSIIQPNLFWHKDAFSIGSVPMEELDATDTFITSKDGLQLRVSKFSQGMENINQVRIDLRPAFLVANPFFSGHGHG
jgi:hypothetical protein